PVGTPALKKWARDLLGCRGCHIDTGQLERIALYRALYCHVMAGMGRHLVLRVDNIHFLVGVVHEHVLGTIFLDALGRAFARLIIGGRGSVLAVPTTVRSSPIRRRG